MFYRKEKNYDVPYVAEKKMILKKCIPSVLKENTIFILENSKFVYLSLLDNISSTAIDHKCYLIKHV